MKKELNLEIITPSKIAYSGKVKSVTVPGTLGNFQILFNHAPLLSTFEIGRIKVVDINDNITEFTTGGGSVEVLKNKILILADSIERREEIDVERARRSLSRAKERLSSKDRDKIDIRRAELSMQRAVNRLKFVGAEF
ncbi:ATP synthase F1 subunit epsilon [Rosettibacter firmus]|uniref:ATP synthase F1 subunit epsilon n=1 Tax=Rosettibacter firmus TaxID=3111522 RepID=UPI00336BCC6D